MSSGSKFGSFGWSCTLTASEMPIFANGAFQAKAVWGILAATGVVWSAGYLLWMYQRVFFGAVTHAENLSLRDLDLHERVALWPTAVMALAMGVAPLLWLNAIAPAVDSTLAPFTQLARRVAR